MTPGRPVFANRAAVCCFYLPCPHLPHPIRKSTTLLSSIWSGAASLRGGTHGAILGNLYVPYCHVLGHCSGTREGVKAEGWSSPTKACNLPLAVLLVDLTAAHAK